MKNATRTLLVCALLLMMATSVHALGAIQLTGLPSALRMDPVWSPAQDYLVALAFDGIYLVRRQDATVRKIYSLNSVDVLSTASFSADSRFVTFIRNGNPVTLRVQDGAVVASPVQMSGISSLAYSPDGRWLAYSVHTPMMQGLFLKDLNTTEEHLLSFFSGRDLRFNADGSQLFYLQYGDKQIMRCNLATDRMPVVHFDLGWYPSFGTQLLDWDISITGSMVGFLANTPMRTPYALYLWERNGMVRYCADNIKDLDMTRDGELAYLSHNWYLERLDTTINLFERIDGASVKQLQYSPEEDCLAYVKFFGTTNQLWLYTFLDPMIPAIPDAPVVADSGTDWVELAVPSSATWYRFYINGVAGPAVRGGTGTYRIDGLFSDQQYQFQLVAMELGFESELSDSLIYQTGAGVPQPPVSLAATQVDVTSFVLQINDSQENVTWLVSLNGGEWQPTDQPQMVFSGLAGESDNQLQVVTVRGAAQSQPISIQVQTLPYPPFAPHVIFPVADGSWRSAPLVLNAVVSEPYLESWYWILDGTVVADQSIVSSEGMHQLQLVARGLNGSEVTFSVGFGLDLTAPQVAFANCADGDIVPFGFKPEVVVTEAYPAGIEYRLNGELTDAATASLGVGQHTVTVRAFDLAGLQGVATISLTVEPLLPVLTEISLPLTDIPYSDSQISVTAGWELPTGAGALRLSLDDGADHLVELPLPAGNHRSSFRVNIPQGLAVGHHRLQAVVADGSGLLSTSLSADFIRGEEPPAAEELQINVEQCHLDRILVCGDDRILELARGLERPLTEAGDDQELNHLARSGEFGIYVVDGTKLSADNRRLLELRALSGDLLIEVQDLLRSRGRSKVKLVSEASGDGYRVVLFPGDLDGALEALAAWEAMPLPADRIPRARHYRIGLANGDGPLAGELQVGLTELAALNLPETGLLAVPLQGASLYLDRVLDVNGGNCVLTEAASAVTRTISVPPLPTLLDEAIRLVDDVALMDVSRKGAHGVWINLNRTIRRLLTINGNGQHDARKAQQLLELAENLLGVIEKLEGRSWPGIHLDLLVLSLRWDTTVSKEEKKDKK